MCAAWNEGYSHHTIHLGRSTCELPLGDSGKTVLWSQIPRAKAGYRKEHSAMSNPTLYCSYQVTGLIHPNKNSLAYRTTELWGVLCLEGGFLHTPGFCNCECVGLLV